MDVTEAVVLTRALCVLAAFAIPDLVHDEHRAPLTRPGHAHVLKLPLRPRVVVTVDEDECGHLRARRRGQVEVGGNNRVLAAPESHVLDAVARAGDDGRDVRLGRAATRRECAQGAAERLDAGRREAAPILGRRDAYPIRGVAPVRLRLARTDVAAQHRGELAPLLGRHDVRIERAECVDQAVRAGPDRLEEEKQQCGADRPRHIDSIRQPELELNVARRVQVARVPAQARAIIARVNRLD